MHRCLVLGGGGFLGSHLVAALLARGNMVRVLDRGEPQPGYPAYLDRQCEWIRGDATCERTLWMALQQMDAVFIFTATSTPASSMELGSEAIEQEYRIVRRVATLAARAQVRRLLFPSSGGGIYGETTANRISEDTPARPLTPHATGKLYSEKTLDELRQAYGLDSIVFRIGNPYGEGQNGTSSFGIVPALMRAAYEGTTATLYGNSIRDYLYVKDIVSIIAHVFDKPHRFPIYNVGSGEGVELTTLVQMVEAVSGRPIACRHVAKRPFDVAAVVLDITRITSEFHLPAMTPLAEGLRRTYNEYVSRRETEIVVLPTTPQPVRIRNISFS